MEEEPATIGREGRVAVDGAIRRDVPERAALDVDIADVARSAETPHAVRDVLSVGRPARGEGLLREGGRNERVSVRDHVVRVEVGDVDRTRAGEIRGVHDAAAVGRHGRIRRPLARAREGRAVAVGRAKRALHPWRHVLELVVNEGDAVYLRRREHDAAVGHEARDRFDRPRAREGSDCGEVTTKSLQHLMRGIDPLIQDI